MYYRPHLLRFYLFLWYLDLPPRQIDCLHAAYCIRYQILTADCGFFDLIGNGLTFSQPIAKKISPSTLIQE